jgi:hypothetical protein
VNEQDLPSFIRDQIDAARRQSDQWRDSVRAGGGREREPVYVEDAPPAIQRIHRRFDAGMERSIVTGKMCIHKDPRRAQPTHVFASEPDLRLCEQCAAPVLAAGSNVCDLCDATCDPTLIHWQRGYLMFHTALCDECYPQGADAPRLQGET